MNKSLGDALLKYDLLSPETKKAINALYTRLEIVADLRKKMRGILDGTRGALLFVVVVTFIVVPAFVSSFYPELLKIGFNWFYILNLAIWSVVAFLINYFSGWRKYKPDFDESVEKFHKTCDQYCVKTHLEAIRFIYEFEPEAVEPLGKSWIEAANAHL